MAGPVWVEQALVYLVGVSDTVLAGRLLGVEAVAAVINAAYFTWFLAGFLMIVSAGATALVARCVGAGDWASARAFCGQAFALAAGIGLAVGLLGPPLARTIAGLLGLEGASADLAAIYLAWLLVATPLTALRIVGIAALRGAGDTKAGMWTMAATNTVNIALSWALVAGWGPLPRLGMTGLAVGTAAAEALGGLILVALLVRGRSGLRLIARDLRPRLDRLARMLRVSLPAAAESLANATCQLWFLRIVNQLGSAAVAAHGIAIRCESLAYLSFLAFGVAGGTVAGQALGGKRPDLAQRGARDAWTASILISLGLAALIGTQAEAMYGLFLGSEASPEVVRPGVTVLRLVCLALPCLATILVLEGVLRGVGDTRWPLAITLAGYLIVRMPLAYLLTGMVTERVAYGLLGAWIAMVLDLLLRCLLVAARFLSGRWTRLEI